MLVRTALIIFGFWPHPVAAVYDRRSGGNQITAVIDRRYSCHSRSLKDRWSLAVRELVCLDRLLRQRSALRIPDSSVGFPPPRGVLTHNTQIDTEVTEASRRGTERCIGVNAIASFARQVDPNFPGPDPKVFLGDLMFVLSGLCDEIGQRNLRSLSVAAHCIATNPALIPDFYPQPDKIPC